MKQENGISKRVTIKYLYRLIYNKEYCKDNIDNLENEEWKAIERTNGKYFVSNKGRIKSYVGYEAIILKYNYVKGY